MFQSLIVTSALVLSLATVAQAEAPMAFDVAEDHTRIFMADAPLHENGMPAHGNAFVSQGYIYPTGTLEAETAGVLEDGSPAFPDLVLGTWTCDGYFVGEGANATTGVWVISRQVFAFADGDTIITQGTEIADAGVENLRPITGTTGDYADIDGGLFQTLLGFNEHMAVNATFRIARQEYDRASYVPGRSSSQVDRERIVDEVSQTERSSSVPIGPMPSS